jgi:hypothetical protein
MKTFILIVAFAASFGTSAQVYVNPQIINLGLSVQVQIFNTTETDINCSGSVYMHTLLGRMETGYYFDQIYFTSHSIYCNKVL